MIDHAAAHGTVLVLVGLNVPWQMESRLSEDEARGQREAIASVQRTCSPSWREEDTRSFVVTIGSRVLL